MNWIEIVNKIRKAKKYPPNILIKIFLYHIIFSKKCISSLMPNKHSLYRFYGNKMFLNLKDPCMRAYALGIYEYWKTMFFIDFIKPGMTVLDIGANKGYFSLLAAEIMNGKGRILSFEPEPHNCFWMKKSIEANGYKLIKLFQIALSDKEGNAELFLGKTEGSHSLNKLWQSLRDDKVAITVETRKLDEILKEERVKKIDFIKIDTEGAEFEVLIGGQNCLKTNRNLIVVMDIHPGVNRNEIYNLLNRSGFKICSVDKKHKIISREDFVKQLCSMEICAFKGEHYGSVA
jgi:FkbM family methyltransferase